MKWYTKLAQAILMETGEMDGNATIHHEIPLNHHFC
jgi:hypothetical protein